MPRLAWDNAQILKTLKQLHRAGKDISYNALAKSQQSLVSAAAYHFGSFRKAVEKAGIDYAEVTRRPRWTKQGIIALIKAAKRKGEDLHWSAVTQRRDEVGKAAFASLQPRLFGRWDKALQAAGLDADEVSQYRRWGKDAVTADLRARSREGGALNSGALQKVDPGLHAAAVRHFGNYDAALRAAKIEPATVRQRQRWTKEQVVQSLREADKPIGKAAKAAPAGAAARKQQAALHSAAVRLFGSLATARAAAKKM